MHATTVHRVTVLAAVLQQLPELCIMPILHSLCCSGVMTIESVEGVQQRDPLGPLLFCLCLHDLGAQMSSELACYYLDDRMLGGSVDDLVHDLDVVVRIGLSLNSEIICQDNATAIAFTSMPPDVRHVSPCDST